MDRRTMLVTLLALAAAGCGSDVTTGPTGQEGEKLQRAAEQKATDEERQYNKDRSTRGGKSKR